MCPKKAADLRGESFKCLADFERGGKVCSICQQGDRREEHHRLAAVDYAAQMGTTHSTGKAAKEAPKEVAAAVTAA